MKCPLYIVGRLVDDNRENGLKYLLLVRQDHDMKPPPPARCTALEAGSGARGRHTADSETGMGAARGKRHRNDATIIGA